MNQKVEYKLIDINNMLKKLIKLSDIRREWRKMKSYNRDTDWFIAWALMYLIESLPSSSLESKKKRKPNKWSVFVGRYLKEGKTVKEASIAWKKLKKAPPGQKT